MDQNKRKKFYDKNFQALLKVVIEWVEKSAPNDKLAKIRKIINLQDDDGQTVMHFAISEKWPNKYKIQLLEWGCNIAIKNKDGKYSLLKKSKLCTF